jgi:hypothetical protein
MSTQNELDGTVELPAVVSTETDKHISMLLIEDGLAQVEDQLKVIETGISEVNEANKQLTERISMLQSRKIAATAQQNLLFELQKKINELSAAQ